MNSLFPATISENGDAHPYHPALAPLYAHFSDTLYRTCAIFTTDPHELAYIAAARWPGFVQPVLDAHTAELSALREEDPDATLELASTTEDARLRLLRHFMPSFTAALEALHPRLTHAAAWARTQAHAPASGVFVPGSPRKGNTRAREAGADTEADAEAAVHAIPRMSRFILVVAFLASMNPPKTDIRMFARGPEARSKRKGGGTRKGTTKAKTGNAKVRGCAVANGMLG